MPDRILRCLLAVLLLAPASGAPAQTVDWWWKTSDSVHFSHVYEGASQVVATPHGLVVAGQRVHVEGAPAPAPLYFLDNDGRLQWRVDISLAQYTYLDAVAANADGIFVHGTAWTYAGRGETTFVHRYSYEGNLVWSFIDLDDAPAPVNYSGQHAKSIVLDEDAIYTTSRIFTEGHTQALIRRFSFDGQLQWQSGFGSAGNPLEPRSLAIGEGLVFVATGRLDPESGRITGDIMLVLGTDGGFKYEFPVRHSARNALRFADDALYVCALDRQRITPIRIDLLGQVEWEFDLGRTGLAEPSCAIDVVANRLYVATNLTPPNPLRWRSGTTVRQWHTDGTLLDTWNFTELQALPYSVSVLDGEVYVAGIDRERNAREFVARLAGDVLAPPSLVRIPGAASGTADRVVAFRHQHGTGSVVARSTFVSASGLDAGPIVQFPQHLRPIDYRVAPDIDGNGHDELVVLSREPALVEIRDSWSGEQLRLQAIRAPYQPVAVALSRTPGSGAADTLAVLVRDPGAPELRVREYDLRTGTKVGVVGFNPNFEPIDFVSVDGGNGRRYALLVRDSQPGGRSKLTIRDTGGSQTVNVWLGRYLDPVAALAFNDGSGAARIAVLRRNAEERWTQVDVVDPAAGSIVQSLDFNGAYEPSDILYSDDVDMNQSPQITVVGQSVVDGSVKLETRDIATGAVTSNTWLSRETPVQDAVYLPAGNGLAPAFGVLVRNNGTNDSYRLFLADTLTGTKLAALDLSFKYGDLSP